MVFDDVLWPRSGWKRMHGVAESTTVPLTSLKKEFKSELVNPNFAQDLILSVGSRQLTK